MSQVVVAGSGWITSELTEADTQSGYAVNFKRFGMERRVHEMKLGARFRRCWCDSNEGLQIKREGLRYVVCQSVLQVIMVTF